MVTEDLLSSLSLSPKLGNGSKLFSEVIISAEAQPTSNIGVVEEIKVAWGQILQLYGKSCRTNCGHRAQGVRGYRGDKPP